MSETTRTAVAGPRLSDLLGRCAYVGTQGERLCLGKNCSRPCPR